MNLNDSKKRNIYLFSFLYLFLKKMTIGFHMIPYVYFNEILFTIIVSECPLRCPEVPKKCPKLSFFLLRIGRSCTYKTMFFSFGFSSVRSCFFGHLTHPDDHRLNKKGVNPHGLTPIFIFFPKEIRTLVPFRTN